MKRLIINADDFGLTPGVNQAIVECHRAGTVTSTTLMANSSAFDGAVQVARQNAKLGVGCHVMMVDGGPLSELPTDSSLLEPGTKSFRNGMAGFALRAMRKGFSNDEIAAEAAAQMRKISSAGIPLTHFDSHKHTHMFPSVLRGVLQAAKERGVRAVRNPFETIGLLGLRRALFRPTLWVRTMEVRALRTLISTFRRSVSDAGMKTTDGTLGIVVTGSLDFALFESMVRAMPEGTWELVCHPGYQDAALNGIRTRLRAAREAELKVLTSPEARRLLDQQGISLINYAEL